MENTYQSDECEDPIEPNNFVINVEPIHEVVETINFKKFIINQIFIGCVTVMIIVLLAMILIYIFN
jgi:hypothetical protein